MNNIVGLSGQIGSGKDLFAEIFAQLSTTPVERHAFADKVRDITELLVGRKMKVTHKAGSPFYNKVSNYTQSDKNIYLPEWDKTIGECLQLIGTELFREHFDKSTWVRSLFNTSGKKCLIDEHILIIPDVRFRNEADYIIDNGGILIRLEGDPMNVRKNSKRDLNHISEIELNNYERFTKVIRNEYADMNIFKSKVQEVVNEYF